MGAELVEDHKVTTGPENGDDVRVWDSKPDPGPRNGRDPLTTSAERISSNLNSSVGAISPSTRAAGPSRTPHSKIERRTKWTIALPVGSLAEVQDILSATSVISGGEELTDTSGSRRDHVMLASFCVRVRIRQSGTVGVHPPT